VTNAPVDVIRIFKDLVRIDTTNPPGNEVAATDYLGALFAEHGIGSEVVEPEPSRTSIVARIGPENDERPIILMSHLDVVAADPAEWDDPPFSATERDGMIYGRGTLDTKYLTAMEVAAFVQLSTEPLVRPVYLVATADEEQGSALGMPIVAERWRDAFAGGVAINEGGGFFVEHDGRPFHLCTAGEKGRCSFTVTMEGSSGPSSFPSDRPAIDTLLRVFERMAGFDFPVEQNPIGSRFEALLGDTISHPFLRSFREYNRRDAIILKHYDAGTQINVLPREIRFEAELHLLPSRTREYAQNLLEEMLAGLDAEWEITQFRAGFASSLESDAFASLRESARDHLNGAELLPVFALGRTDGQYLGALGCDVYGFGPVDSSIPFSEVLTLVHQKNEKMSCESLRIGRKVVEELIRRTGQGL
jgi:acetylornithine deacetylase/succinyl-diaminopimelate desuccinylase-like protein